MSLKVNYHITLKKSTPQKILTEIFNRYAPYLVDNQDDELVDISTTDWYKNMDKEMEPKDYLKNLREAHSFTQKELGEKISTNAAHISDYENGQRAISKDIAKKLAEVFHTSPAIFI
jgi:DNA-binding XRE family transcriptional regulator